MKRIEYKSVRCCGNCKKYRTDVYNTCECQDEIKIKNETDFCPTHEHNGISDLMYVKGLKIAQSCRNCEFSSKLSAYSCNDDWICRKNPDVFKHCYPDTVCEDYKECEGLKEGIRHEFISMFGEDLYGIRKAGFCLICKHVIEKKPDQFGQPNTLLCSKHDDTEVKYNYTCDKFEKKNSKEECANCKFVNKSLLLKGDRLKEQYKCFAEKEPSEVNPDDCCENFTPREN